MRKGSTIEVRDHISMVIFSAPEFQRMSVMVFIALWHPISGMVWSGKILGNHWEVQILISQSTG